MTLILRGKFEDFPLKLSELATGFHVFNQAIRGVAGAAVEHGNKIMVPYKIAI